VMYPVSWAASVQLASFAVIVLSWVLYLRRDSNRRRHDRAITRGACDDGS
jgi:hypothetical protein